MTIPIGCWRKDHAALLRQPQIGFLIHHDIPALAILYIQDAQVFMNSGQRVASHAVVVDVDEETAIIDPAAQGTYQNDLRGRPSPR